MKRILTVQLLAVPLALSFMASMPGARGDFILDWYTMDAGGAMRSAGGPYQMSATLGQPDAGVAMTGSNYGLTGGFWAGVPPFALGDLNCDGAVNFGDINPFVLALSDPEEYRRQFPNCDINLADCNGDGKIDFGDINPFVELLSGAR